MKQSEINQYFEDMQKVIFDLQKKYHLERDEFCGLAVPLSEIAYHTSNVKLDWLKD